MPIDAIRKWLSRVIIDLGLCPFAKKEFDADRIHYAVLEGGDPTDHLEQIVGHCAALDENLSRETSLLIFPDALTEFEVYLDFLEIAEALLEAQGYSGEYQLASFHPAYQFEGVEAGDASHYTNKSPYPMIHILREASVSRAVAEFPNPANIPDRNIKLTRAMGVDTMRSLLAACYK